MARPTERSPEDGRADSTRPVSAADLDFLATTIPNQRLFHTGHPW